jgi:hypothetical protein
MRKNHRLFGFILLAFLSVSWHSAHAAATGDIPIGTVLPQFQLAGPTSKAEQEYLGLKGSKPFTLAQVSGKFLIMDFFTVL